MESLTEAVLRVLARKGIKPMPPLYPGVIIDRLIELDGRVMVRLADGRKFTILRSALRLDAPPSKPKPKPIKKD